MNWKTTPPSNPDRTLRERDIEGYLVKRVTAMGGEVRKVEWIGRRGAPDRLVMLPRRVEPHALVSITHRTEKQTSARTYWVELKAPGVKPEDHQVREHNRMRALGQTVVVVDSLKGVDEVLS